MDYYKVISLINLCSTTILYYAIIPELVNEDEQNNASHIVSLLSSVISLLLNIYSISFTYINLIYIFIFAFIISIVISGIYWWIPTYVPKDEQDRTERYLIMITSLLVMLSTIFQSSAVFTGSSTVYLLSSGKIGGKRK